MQDSTCGDNMRTGIRRYTSRFVVRNWRDTGMYDTLVDSNLLAMHLGEPRWVICDCRFSLTTPDAGAAAYRANHIPGAVYFHLDHDLAGPVTPHSGRHPLPDAEQFAATLGRVGVTHGVQIVAYDDMHGAFAARLWWLARWLGHREVAVLDGGWQAWIAGGKPVSMESSTPVPQQFMPQRDDTRWVGNREAADTASGRRTGKLFDARAADRFRGENETLDPVAGHVPGAVNLPFAGNIDNTGHFQSPASLRRRFESALGGTSPEQAISMCGSGVTACHNLLAMEQAGLHGARLYAGSWSEWIRDPTRPIVAGV